MNKQGNIGLVFVFIIFIVILAIILFMGMELFNDTELKIGDKYEYDGNIIELSEINGTTATFKAYPKGAVNASQKYKFTVEEGETERIALEHCYLIDMVVKNITSDTVKIQIIKVDGCVE